ncbi:hypothetical protein EX30DRAFT_363249 [Ascodesmis nigricans]|uniref:ATP-dependent RNA helicase n=1 Tax=Ascodesmis nigricans TaxID=341454 RepID=A0A4S2MZF4_9PEZI|nr:hypothetical protein EX30DRAFT_363249 [Ascodesmis nigricans]
MLSSAARSKYICLACRSRLLRQSNPAPRLLSSAGCRTYSSFGSDSTYPGSPRQRSLDNASSRPSFGASKFKSSRKPTLAERDDFNLPFEDAGPEGVADEEPVKNLSDILDSFTERHQKKTSKFAPSAPGFMLSTDKQWRSLGVRDVVAKTIARAFPNIRRPTYTQVRMLPPLMNGNSVVVSDLPGTGKSFSIALWLLSLERATRGYVNGKPDISTTALVLVPNIDLALQYRSIILHLLKNTNSEAINRNPHAFVQVLYRSKEHEGEMLNTLIKNPRPHIVIATPSILLDILSNGDPAIRDLIDYHSLKAIVLDEIDSALAKYDTDALTSAEEEQGEETKPGEKEKRDPAMILLDWVFKARRAHALKAEKKPAQPQLVVSSSSLGRVRILKTLETHHPTWFDGDKRPGGFTLMKPSPASHVVLVNSRSKSNRDTNRKHLPLVTETIQHHVVFYDVDTGSLRDADLPPCEDPFEAIVEFTRQERMMVRDFEDAIAAQDDVAVAKLLAMHQHASSAIARTGYPVEIAVDALQTLLEHDNHPENAMAAIGEAVSMKAFIEECSKRGITARPLQFDTWNEHAPLPLGRTDQAMSLESSKTTDEPKSTVWVTNYYSARGLDTPGITHGYILHRLNKVREYVTYCGRVARWPYTSSYEQLRDSRSMGRDKRPLGKVVSVLLESDHTLQNVSMIRKDVPESSQSACTMEAIRLAKVSAMGTPYLKEPEVERKADEAVKIEAELDENVKMETEMDGGVDAEKLDEGIEGETKLGVDGK